MDKQKEHMQLDHDLKIKRLEKIMEAIKLGHKIPEGY